MKDLTCTHFKDLNTWCSEMIRVLANWQTSHYLRVSRLIILCEFLLLNGVKKAQTRVLLCTVNLFLMIYSFILYPAGNSYYRRIS
jgi:hypothetical protein